MAIHTSITFFIYLLTTPTSSQNINSPPSTLKLQPRDPPPTPTLDLSLLPSCVQKNCLSSTISPLPCPTITTSCPENAPSGTKTCTTYPLSCYCTLPTPLSCSFHPCSWFDWQLAEDLYSNLCPLVPPINFSTLPKCARECVQDNAFDYGCITGGATCFCTHGSLFGCDGKCKGKDKDKVVDWYMRECKATKEDAMKTLGDKEVEVEKGDGPVPKLSGRRIRWYEVMACVVAAMTLVLFVVGVVALWVFEKAVDGRKRK